MLPATRVRVGARCYGAAVDEEISISVSELRAHVGRILDAVEHGRSFIITRRGRPIARLVSHRSSLVA